MHSDLEYWSHYAALLTVFYTMYKGLDATAIGEFDTFFLSVRFLIFGTLFSASWLLGAAFARWRYAHYLIAATCLLASILLIAKQKTDSVTHLLQAFLPAVLYSFYIIFAAEQIYHYKDKSQKFWWFMSRRVLLFLLLIGSVGALVTYKMQGKFEQAVANAGGNGDKGENGMLTKNKEGNFDLKDYAQLRSNQGRGNELLFAAHIDNFLPGTDIPNPLYLTAFYYTKFDTSTETFERDKQIPKNDLFEPNVAAIPLYNTRIDSSVIINGMGDQARRVVELEVYNKQLSPETYLAPNIGFFVQPIAIEKDFRGEFKSAFRAKGYVSELNSAYFIYNAKDPQIKAFQEQRFKVLRTAGGYENIDKRFMAYYTQMPKDAKFQRITALANQIAAQAKTPVDKVLALRDYFLSKDAEGNPLFSYTDNPGVPDIPSASKLMYFLFDNHKGYCAYYAGATLFMLRSLGIPSRITVGFMTIDRSDKNKGWYWYYADQAHAWVQVYFPGFGWLDFDTTVGNDDAQESPSPDGTPPMQPPHAWFASEGQIVAIDTLKRTLQLKVAQILFHDKAYKTKHSATNILLDVSMAYIQKDSMPLALKEVKVGDTATAVSYADAIKKMQDANAKDCAETIMAKMPSPAPMDDVYIKKTPEQIKEEQLQKAMQGKPFSWKDLILKVVCASVLLFLLFLSIPMLIFNYFKIRSKTAKDIEQKAYWQYCAFSFLFTPIRIF
jgi:protein-glutamine gamma-glutamyltransferase